MKTLFLTFLIYFSLFSSTYASSFNSIIGIGYDDSVLDKRVTFNGNELKGLNSAQLELLKFQDVSINGARKNNFAEYLKIPPSTLVTFYLWIENISDMNVDLFDIDLYLSRSNPTSGDLTKIGAVGDLNSIDYEVDGIAYSRRSKVAKIQLDKSFDNISQNEPERIYDFVVTTPISFEDISYAIRKFNNKYDIDFTIVIENKSGLNLCHLTLSNYDQEFCIEPYSRKILTLTQKDKSGSYTTSFTVDDNNRHYLSTTSQMLNLQDRNPETHPAILNTSIGQIPVMGETIKNLTIELIPYELTSEEIHVNVPVEIKEEKEIKVIKEKKDVPVYMYPKQEVKESVIETPKSENKVVVLSTKINSKIKEESPVSVDKSKLYRYLLIGIFGIIIIIILIRLWYY